MEHIVEDKEVFIESKQTDIVIFLLIIGKGKVQDTRI